MSKIAPSMSFDGVPALAAQRSVSAAIEAAAEGREA